MRTPFVLATETEDSAQAIERMRMRAWRSAHTLGSESGALEATVTLDDLLRQFAGDATALLDVRGGTAKLRASGTRISDARYYYLTNLRSAVGLPAI